MDNLVGKRLDGRYELQEIIGVGGMAVVYKAYDSIDDRVVAVKILKEEFVANEEFRRRFKNESKAIAVLSHPNIVKVYDVSFGDNLQYIVMEHINGIPLKRFIERRGVLTTNDAVHFTLQILRALQHAHEKGIIHRDIKPQNIMLLQDGTIKVTDFGIARFSQNEQRTMTDQAIGSVHYISPEQARGDYTDGKADIYSVGVMLYEMITGKLPFEADSAVSVAIMQLQSEPQSPRVLNPLIPLGLEQITLRAMQKNPRMRFKSAAEMLLDMEDFQRNPEITFSYDYFVDDSPTKYVTGNKTATSEIEPLEDDYDYDEVPAKSPVIPILAGVASAFVIIMVIVGIFIWKTFINPEKVGEVILPNFVGMNYEEIKNDPKYKEYGFKFIEDGYLPSDEFEANEVISQKPKDGIKVKKNSEVRLKISQGPKLIQLVDVSDYDIESAKSKIESQGFVFKSVEIDSQTVPVGRVVNTFPDAGSQLKAGTEITAYISTGPQAKFVEVPNVVGMEEDYAKEQLLRKNLVAKVESEDNLAAKGTVLSQNPAKGEIKTGSTVVLKVSTGKAPVVTRTAKIEIYLPGGQMDYVILKSKPVRVKVYLDDKEVFLSAPYDVTRTDPIDVTFETIKEKGHINVVLLGSTSNSAEYPYMEFEYNFVSNIIVPNTEKFPELDPKVFPRETEEESSMPNNSSSSGSLNGNR